MSATTQKVPGPDHPITIAPSDARVVVKAGDTVVADSTHALSLQEASYPAVLYVPMSDVQESVLKPSDTHSYCPYKGEASYYSVATDEATVKDAIWFYPEPYDAVAPIAGHVAFYPDRVQIEVG